LSIGSQTRDCPKCGASMGAGTRFCPSCGFRIDETPGGEPAGVARSASQGLLQRIIPRKLSTAERPEGTQARTASEFTQPVASWPSKCPNCGFDLKAGVKYCPSCGFNVEVWLKRRSIPGGKSTPGYYTSRKRFFSFEGYSLEGVTPAAAMFLIWGLWNILMGGLALVGQVKVFYLTNIPNLYETTTLTIGVLFGLGFFLLLSAFGLMQVNSILYLLGIIAMVVSLPLSIVQIAYAMTATLPTGPVGTQQFENLLTGFLGILISIVGLVQTIRIRKYFFGGD